MVRVPAINHKLVHVLWTARGRGLDNQCFTLNMTCYLKCEDNIAVQFEHNLMCPSNENDPRTQIDA
jgi:hypothetical protein